jgi:hypothetical protein
MLACTITSRAKVFLRLFCKSISLSLLLMGVAILEASNSHAQTENPTMMNGPGIPSGSGKKEETGLFDQSSPYLDYGDFNMNEDENEDTLYFQYGRFFGLSLGLGYQQALGNRGKLYSPAFPRLDLRVQYWFNFNFALDLGVFFVNHSFNDPSNGDRNTAVKMIGYGVHLKYYFDVRDKSAALTFSNPFISAGIGAMSKAESTSVSSVPDNDSTLSVDLGGGFEFPIVYKKTYFILEGLYHTQNFADTNENKYSAKVPDMSGGFVTLIGHFMFVW